jgi:hypothetical protein
VEKRRPNPFRGAWPAGFSAPSLLPLIQTIHNSTLSILHLPFTSHNIPTSSSE